MAARMKHKSTQSPAEQQLCQTALDLLGKQGWETTTLAQITEACGKNPPSVQLRSKSDLIPLIVGWMDQQATPRDSFDTAIPIEDRLFDLLMLRFEAMLPYKKGICAIAEACRRTPDLAGPMYTAQKRAMTNALLHAGSEKSHTAVFALQTHLLLGIYNYVFLVWERESSPQMDQTMARLNNTLHAYNWNFFFRN